MRGQKLITKMDDGSSVDETPSFHRNNQGSIRGCSTDDTCECGCTGVNTYLSKKEKQMLPLSQIS